ncbi:hypothetical protein ACOMHN_048641 [Nucella lapillus]
MGNERQETETVDLQQQLIVFQTLGGSAAHDGKYKTGNRDCGPTAAAHSVPDTGRQCGPQWEMKDRKQRLWTYSSSS